VAGEMARHLGAAALAFLTDVAGVLDSQGHVLERLSPVEAERLLQAGTVTGGMIPKVEAARAAAAAGIRAVILDGRRSHALRDALEGRGAGTVIA